MQRLKPEVRERIRSAALEEFKECGFENASIRRIAESAGVSLGNVYRYYESKEALYLAATAPLRSAAVAFLRELDNESNPVVLAEKVTEFCCTHTLLEADAELAEKIAERMKKPGNPELRGLIAQGFLQSVLALFKTDAPKQDKTGLLADLITFFFETK